MPRLPLVVRAGSAHLAANFYHIITNALAHQQFCHAVHGVALGYCAEVEPDARVAARDDARLVNVCLLITNELHEAVYHLRRHVGAVLEAEAPRAHQGLHRGVEVAAGNLADAKGAAHHLCQHRVSLRGLAPVDAAECALLIEKRKGVVHAPQRVEDKAVERLRCFIFDVVGCAEDAAFGGAECYPGEAVAVKQDKSRGND